MIGIKFIIENECNTVLKKILRNIDYSKYKCVVIEEEVYDKYGNDFFDKLFYNGEDFEKVIYKEHYPIFLNLQLFDKDARIDKIENYKDFLQSDCKLVLFITDNSFVDIYTRDTNLLNNILNNAAYYHFENVKHICSFRDVRDKFSAYTD